MEKLLIIGSKKYLLDMNNLLDKFDRNIRINFSLPMGNNGTKIDQLYLNCHIYANFFEKWVKDTKQLPKKYPIEKSQEIMHIRDNKLYSKCYKQKYLNNSINRVLKKLKLINMCKIQPRLGLETMILHVNNKPIIYGFSINKENNTHIIFQDNISQCHDEDSEHLIVLEMHQKKLIDATLCMLEYSNEPILDCTILEPSEFCLKLLLEEFKEVKIRGDKFDNSLIEKNNWKIRKEDNLLILSK